MSVITRAACARLAAAFLLAALPATAFAATDIAKLTADATAGNAEAQFDLGNAYMKGDGVAADPAAAARWCLMAAQQGYTKAEIQMGLKYANGNGVAADHAQADMWLVLASRADAHNVAILHMVEGHFTPDEITRGHVAADQWHATPATPAASSTSAN